MKLLLVPHFYMINWAKDLSELLYESNKFVTPDSYNRNLYMPYSRLKNSVDNWIKKANSLDYDGYFFTNIQDYVYSDLEFDKPVYGIIHGSRMVEHEPGNSQMTRKELEKIKTLELDRFGKIKFAFITTNTFKEFMNSKGIDVPCKVTGLPLFTNPDYEYNRKRDLKILFANQIAVRKNPAPLFNFPEEWRKNIIMSIPVAFSMAFSKELKKNEEIMTINRDNGKAETRQKYETYLKTSKYGISLSKYENFAFSVREGLLSGVCFLCPNHSNVPFKEFVHPEALYDGELLRDEKRLIDTIISMIEKFEANDELRIEAIKYSQKKLEQYHPRTWMDGIIKKLDEVK